MVVSSIKDEFYDVEHDVKYCCKHGRKVETRLSPSGERFHLLEFQYDRGEIDPCSSLDTMICYGDFAEAEPPPALTELEWKQILSMEEEVEEWLS